MANSNRGSLAALLVAALSVPRMHAAVAAARSGGPRWTFALRPAGPPPTVTFRRVRTRLFSRRAGLFVELLLSHAGSLDAADRVHPEEAPEGTLYFCPDANGYYPPCRVSEEWVQASRYGVAASAPETFDGAWSPLAPPTTGRQRVAIAASERFWRALRVGILRASQA